MTDDSQTDVIFKEKKCPEGYHSHKNASDCHPIARQHRRGSGAEQGHNEWMARHRGGKAPSGKPEQGGRKPRVKGPSKGAGEGDNPEGGKKYGQCPEGQHVHYGARRCHPIEMKHKEGSKAEEAHEKDIARRNGNGSKPRGPRPEGSKKPKGEGTGSKDGKKYGQCPEGQHVHYGARRCHPIEMKHKEGSKAEEAHNKDLDKRGIDHEGTTEATPKVKGKPVSKEMTMLAGKREECPKGQHKHEGAEDCHSILTMHSGTLTSEHGLEIPIMQFHDVEISSYRRNHSRRSERKDGEYVDSPPDGSDSEYYITPDTPAPTEKISHRALVPSQSEGDWRGGYSDPNLDWGSDIDTTEAEWIFSQGTGTTEEMEYRAKIEKTVKQMEESVNRLFENNPTASSKEVFDALKETIPSIKGVSDSMGELNATMSHRTALSIVRALKFSPVLCDAIHDVDVIHDSRNVIMSCGSKYSCKLRDFTPIKSGSGVYAVHKRIQDCTPEELEETEKRWREEGFKQYGTCQLNYYSRFFIDEGCVEYDGYQNRTDADTNKGDQFHVKSSHDISSAVIHELGHSLNYWLVGNIIKRGVEVGAVSKETMEYSALAYVNNPAKKMDGGQSPYDNTKNLDYLFSSVLSTTDYSCAFNLSDTILQEALTVGKEVYGINKSVLSKSRSRYGRKDSIEALAEAHEDVCENGDGARLVNKLIMLSARRYESFAITGIPPKNLDAMIEELLVSQGRKKKRKLTKDPSERKAMKKAQRSQRYLTFSEILSRLSE